MPTSHFQVKLGGDFKNYEADEDKMLKRAYLSGAPNAKYSVRGQKYEVNFQKSTQKNSSTSKEREIRPPFKWKPPAGGQLVKTGPTMCIKVPPGAPGKIIQVPVGRSGKLVAVNVPATAKVGQSMLVPIPQGKPATIKIVEPSAAEAAAVEKMSPCEKAKAKKKWSTGGKVAAGTAGLAVLGGVAVGGAILGEHIAEEGLDATVDDLGDTVATVGDHIVAGGEAAADGLEDAGVTDALADAGEEAGDWLTGAGEDVADFIMDIF